jgi:hypothetical protein
LDDVRVSIGDRCTRWWFLMMRGLPLLMELLEPMNGCRLIDAARADIPRSPEVANTRK